ncbi:MAG: chemotaxis protein CheW [Acidobacteria bacterium Pan2503]|uniref:Chemotaxis protein CheW n=1 Tax=Candidatus Acidiferrum panamense TaxID=2741543 RepID=A0A7V8NM44_9BACT|nr:chemotaxis protein CheW [Candidatus Acidoferrum panamensis]
MTVSTELELKSFVLLRLGERRFAVAADDTAELVSPSRVFSFPHRTPGIEGVILRRGRIVPVCDVAEKLIGTRLTTRRFYLIALRRYGQRTEWVAIPVTGECELINAELTAASASDEPHVAAWLSHGGDVIEVLNLDALTPGLENLRVGYVVASQAGAQTDCGREAEARP